MGLLPLPLPLPPPPCCAAGAAHCFLQRMLAHALRGLQGTGGQKGLSQRLGVHALAGHGIRMHTFRHFAFAGFRFLDGFPRPLAVAGASLPVLVRRLAEQCRDVGPSRAPEQIMPGRPRLDGALPRCGRHQAV